MINVVAFAFTGYPVTNIRRARAFYEDLLGLRPASVFGEGDTQWVEYELGDATLAISNMAPDWKPGPGPSVALEVKDFAAAVAELQKHAVPFILPATESPVCHLAVVRDPDGNFVTIHHRKAAPAA
jgi:catechol 2,3-dioxygenase-like lactoylglutathione lyase family enzyme